MYLRFERNLRQRCAQYRHDPERVPSSEAEWTTDSTLPHETAGSNPELDGNPRYFLRRAFHSRFLRDDRDISVYLPEAYAQQPQRHFPVFYLHDGQNLFDGRTSYVVNRTWRAHATADYLTREGVMEPVILVGVNNTGVRRMAEYTPTRDFRARGR